MISIYQLQSDVRQLDKMNCADLGNQSCGFKGMKMSVLIFFFFFKMDMKESLSILVQELAHQGFTLHLGHPWLHLICLIYWNVPTCVVKNETGLSEWRSGSTCRWDKSRVLTDWRPRNFRLHRDANLTLKKKNLH